MGEKIMFQFNRPIIILITSLLSLVFIHQIFFKPSSSTKTKRPPSPFKLPIIGNLLQVGPLAHQDLHSMAKIHGPLMLLHFGSVPVLVISSAGLAREIMKTHDTVFANRPASKALKKLTYNRRDVSLSPYGEYWRQMRSIAVLRLLSNKRVQSFFKQREEETTLFVNKVLESSSSGEEELAVDLSSMFGSFANDVIGRASIGRKLSESEHGEKFLAAMKVAVEVGGAINIGDYIPWLDWIGRFNGYDKRLDESARELDRVNESLIEERQQFQREKSGEEDFLDIVLEIYNAGDIERESVKAVFQDMFIAGTDTTSAALEWAMSELLRHPATMEKLQKEVRGIVKKGEEIRDDDLEHMHYMKAVIKETLRLHPPLPLLSSRVSTQDVQINGFDIRVGTLVMINAWAIGRDPTSWDEPEKFEPDRFLNSSVDYRGQDFELIPFGAGRRGCPGTSFGTAVVEFMLANLVHKFDWKLANRVEGKDLDMSETPGLTAHRDVPLLAVASYIKSFGKVCEDILLHV